MSEFIKRSQVVPPLAAVIHTFLSLWEQVIDIDQRKHGESSDKGAGLDRYAAPQQGSMTSLMQQSADNHLHIGEESSETNTGDDL